MDDPPRAIPLQIKARRQINRTDAALTWRDVLWAVCAGALYRNGETSHQGIVVVYESMDTARDIADMYNEIVPVDAPWPRPHWSVRAARRMADGSLRLLAPDLPAVEDAARRQLSWRDE